MRDRRIRHALFAALVVACVAGAAAAILSAAGARSGAPSASAQSLLHEARASGRAMVLFRDGGNGRVALAPADSTAQARGVGSLECARVTYAGARGICLSRSGGFAAGYEAMVLGPDLGETARVALEGIPSRARVSPDGRYGATTFFVTGHSYADAGAFSTETTLLDLERGTKIATLEDFRVTHRDELVTAVDVNFWGVTFADDGDRFYATMATGGRTYLIEGSIDGRRARVLHENVECPSLSPDGTRIAYKRRTGSRAEPWRLTVLDLATLEETPLAEPRSIDDQPEWLDDAHVLYARDGDVWQVRSDGTGQPSRYVAGADSPAVIRW